MTDTLHEQLSVLAEKAEKLPFGEEWVSVLDKFQALAWRNRAAILTALQERDRLREALKWYADQMCEGFCQGKDPKACAHIGAGNCAGCPAVVALSQEPSNVG